MLELRLLTVDAGKNEVRLLCCGQVLVAEDDYVVCPQCRTAYGMDELCALVHKAIVTLQQLAQSIAQGVQSADNASHSF